MSWISISDAEKIKRLLFGSLRFRFAALLITSGVFLVGGGSLREYVFLAITELLGLEDAYTTWENADKFSQVTGLILILIGVVFFLYPLFEEWRIKRKSIKAQIIHNWSRGEELTSEHIEWLQTNNSWAEKFWDTTRKTELSTRERLKLMKKIK